MFSMFSSFSSIFSLVFLPFWRVVFSPGHVGSLTDGALWDDLGRAAARQKLRCPIHLGISVGDLAAEKEYGGFLKYTIYTMIKSSYLDIYIYISWLSPQLVPSSGERSRYC